MFYRAFTSWQMKHLSTCLFRVLKEQCKEGNESWGMVYFLKKFIMRKSVMRVVPVLLLIFALLSMVLFSASI